MITVPIFSSVVVALILYLFKYRRFVKRREKENSPKEIYLRELASNYNKHEMEVNKKEVELYERLGEGAFGVVHRGKLLKCGTDVAVKMLKGEHLHFNISINS